MDARDFFEKGFTQEVWQQCCYLVIVGNCVN